LLQELPARRLGRSSRAVVTRSTRASRPGTPWGHILGGVRLPRKGRHAWQPCALCRARPAASAATDASTEAPDRYPSGLVAVALPQQLSPPRRSRAPPTLRAPPADRAPAAGRPTASGRRASPQDLRRTWRLPQRSLFGTSRTANPSESATASQGSPPPPRSRDDATLDARRYAPLVAASRPRRPAPPRFRLYRNIRTTTRARPKRPRSAYERQYPESLGRGGRTT